MEEGLESPNNKGGAYIHTRGKRTRRDSFLRQHLPFMDDEATF